MRRHACVRAFLPSVDRGSLRTRACAFARAHLRRTGRFFCTTPSTLVCRLAGAPLFARWAGTQGTAPPARGQPCVGWVSLETQWWVRRSPLGLVLRSRPARLSAPLPASARTAWARPRRTICVDLTAPRGVSPEARVCVRAVVSASSFPWSSGLDGSTGQNWTGQNWTATVGRPRALWPSQVATRHGGCGSQAGSRAAAQLRAVRD